MKKNIIKAAFVAAFASIAGYGVYTSQQKVEMSDLAKANVEALANGEDEGGKKTCYNSITTMEGSQIFIVRLVAGFQGQIHYFPEKVNVEK